MEHQLDPGERGRWKHQNRKNSEDPTAVLFSQNIRRTGAHTSSIPRLGCLDLEVFLLLLGGGLQVPSDVLQTGWSIS